MYNEAEKRRPSKGYSSYRKAENVLITRMAVRVFLIGT